MYIVSYSIECKCELICLKCLSVQYLLRFKLYLSCCSIGIRKGRSCSLCISWFRIQSSITIIGNFYLYSFAMTVIGIAGLGFSHLFNDILKCLSYVTLIITDLIELHSSICCILLYLMYIVSFPIECKRELFRLKCLSVQYLYCFEADLS